MTPLHHFGEALRNLLGTVPIAAARILFVLVLVVLLVWVLRLPASETSPEGGARRWDENLKFGAGLALGIQIIIYVIL